ncbi:methionine synthase (B12-independent) [Stella humosa]|uniref:Methionine synthase (B12-independent) n=1 Tax=Stella humosa TaxID=94 RepID=A0A3N1KY45_9PROT|nr:cobalamin-independent methionine synthase II family protein [Stella humosa]ROP83510.1 methionine synthase (B12-independent) [Stella humosa]BBK33217.1 5-methyltetrahydropteroyltriglutamate--homocysteine methyltransferase [Stella humosa]
MAILTTTIGSYPKPDYVRIPNWFEVRRRLAPGQWNPTQAYEQVLADQDAEHAERLDRGTREVVAEQADAGIDIPTDGEVRREHYIYHQCRRFPGFDFARLTSKAMRGGSWLAAVPTVTGPVTAGTPGMPADWRIAQSATDRPVKMTLPGPLTIIDSTADAHYHDDRRLAADLADALNHEIRALAEAGCRWIQVDEPVFARQLDRALDFGVEMLDRCFHGVPAATRRAVHICCGYPAALDLEDFPKADRRTYFDLADALEETAIDAVSIEDAHRRNDLSLIERFRSKTLILGVVEIARTRVETVDEIRARIADVLEHIEPARLIAAPDCGLIMLDRATAVAKLRNLSAAARSFG